jgi:hypothetical protein
MAAPRTMSEAHKEALAKGREAGRAVRDYLTAMEAAKPKRGRKISRDDLEKRLAETKANIVTADPVRRLELVQERIDLESRLAKSGEAGPDLAALEKAFTKHAKAYGESKGISYQAWREIGVTPPLLMAAGITR